MKNVKVFNTKSELDDFRWSNNYKEPFISKTRYKDTVETDYIYLDDGYASAITVATEFPDSITIADRDYYSALTVDLFCGEEPPFPNSITITASTENPSGFSFISAVTFAAAADTLTYSESETGETYHASYRGPVNGGDVYYEWIDRTVYEWYDSANDYLLYVLNDQIPAEGMTIYTFRTGLREIQPYNYVITSVHYSDVRTGLYDGLSIDGYEILNCSGTSYVFYDDVVFLYDDRYHFKTSTIYPIMDIIYRYVNNFTGGTYSFSGIKTYKSSPCIFYSDNNYMFIFEGKDAYPLGFFEEGGYDYSFGVTETSEQAAEFPPFTVTFNGSVKTIYKGGKEIYEISVPSWVGNGLCIIPLMGETDNLLPENITIYGTYMPGVCFTGSTATMEGGEYQFVSVENIPNHDVTLSCYSNGENVVGYMGKYALSITYDADFELERDEHDEPIVGDPIDIVCEHVSGSTFSGFGLVCNASSPIPSVGSYAYNGDLSTEFEITEVDGVTHVPVGPLYYGGYYEEGGGEDMK